MRLVVALGGNALLRRDQLPTAENQLANIKRIAPQLAQIAKEHELIVTHGNGPQVGLLALQSAAYLAVPAYPLDMLGAQTDGMIGYLLEQELTNLLPNTRVVATLLTRVEVDPQDPAFLKPTKPIGPQYAQSEAQQLAKVSNWSIAPDGDKFRRVVASPLPLRVLGLKPIRWLLEHHAIVIAAGGGGIPVARIANGASLEGVDAVIDKDLCSGLLARELNADCLIIATDVTAVYVDWGKPNQRALSKTTPSELAQHTFAEGSMAPKVQAAVQFVESTGQRALIGSLDQIHEMLLGKAGTEVSADAYVRQATELF